MPRSCWPAVRNRRFARSASPASPRRVPSRPISMTSPNPPGGPMAMTATASGWGCARDARPDRAANAQPRQSQRWHRGRRSRATQGQGTVRQGGSQQQLWLWRHQCQPGHARALIGMMIKRLLAGGAILALLVLASLYWLLWAGPGPATGPHRLVVEEGTSLYRLSDDLVREGLVPGNARTYRVMARIFGSSD